MNGKIATFFKRWHILFCFSFILYIIFRDSRLLTKTFIQIFNNLSDSCIDFLIGQYFLYRVYEENIKIAIKGQHMLLLAPAFADASFEKVTFYGSLEEFL